MDIYACIAGNSNVQLWHLDSRERITRQFKQLGTIQEIDSLKEVPLDAAVLLVRADYLYEVRTLQIGLDHSDSVLMHPADERPAMAFVSATHAESVLASMLDNTALPSEINPISLESLNVFDRQLRKSKPPLLEPIDAPQKVALESLLYGSAYKGITDLVTKFWWPRPARYGVACSARFGLTPNAITTVGFALMLLACYLFAQGQFALGLLAGWIMTYLDTVDGKLARVTITSSRFGHLFDHGMDLIHPPFWYVYWGGALVAVPALWGLDLQAWNIMIIGGYVLGRVIEALFHLLGACSIFSWRPCDAYFRLVTARRNPCLILLTLSIFVGHPEWGFIAVALWTAISTGWLLVRLLFGVVERLRHGPLTSWLSDPQKSAREHSRAYNTFSGTRSAYGA